MVDVVPSTLISFSTLDSWWLVFSGFRNNGKVKHVGNVAVEIQPIYHLAAGVGASVRVNITFNQI
jgi:hypothetical protein